MAKSNKEDYWRLYNEAIDYILGKLGGNRSVPITFTNYSIYTENSYVWVIDLNNDYRVFNLVELETDQITEIVSELTNSSKLISDIKLWQLLNNITDEDLDYWWDYLSSFGHTVISNLDRQGMKWKDLRPDLIPQLKEQFEKMEQKVLYSDENSKTK